MSVFFKAPWVITLCSQGGKTSLLSHATTLDVLSTYNTKTVKDSLEYIDHNIVQFFSPCHESYIV